LLKTVVAAGEPVLDLVTMVVVGMEQTILDFRWDVRQPRTVVAATL
jgi:hypothetical protein